MLYVTLFSLNIFWNPPLLFPFLKNHFIFEDWLCHIIYSTNMGSLREQILIVQSLIMTEQKA